ncbi:Imm1 family immunity protein [Streptomyces sp. NPDC058011]|uniref:Imm1 family immunity protein n=1 Tax=Streptomyces sp. NPDC058011 TaxID=3346305 RepID=UPI0036EE4C04
MHRAFSQCDVEGGVSRALNELYSEGRPSVGIDPGSIATFHVFDVSDESNSPDRAANGLTLGINQRTRYGGMIWYGEEIIENPSQFHWVSKSENPPEIDPRVIADPWQPLWYAKGNCLPFSEIERSLIEFCFNGGGRPTAVGWEPSSANGERLHPKQLDQ